MKPEDKIRRLERIEAVIIHTAITIGMVAVGVGFYWLFFASQF
mgnify:FL=1